MISISETAKENSTIIFDVSFTDEDDADVTPESIAWTLVDSQDNVINSRDGVSVSVPAPTVSIVLTGDDLQIQTSERYQKKVYRYLIVEAIYNSDAGDGLSITESIRFKVENLIHLV
ncbi:hypothetical protein A2619_03430 [candidate division WWE3 bacterium RIFOXYD1_FULL_39_9]|uniref:SbsA Ig-like domain-containing protein n=1 Tax=candidate division WWE3 bacterium RIFOXYD1_FULL_39_9 TaxID=1802649 RepID=A0A1F4X5M0_UNCKA|nr:MAG: hypothetical protein A2619_03430 [candidate division WWE3 bacterium RIFOXYD1_FULL_39_9]